MKPTIGRIVILVNGTDRHPAIITYVDQDEESVDLVVFRRHNNENVHYVPGPNTAAPHWVHWEWPERGA